MLKLMLSCPIFLYRSGLGEELGRAEQKVRDNRMGKAFDRRWPGIEVGEDGLGFKKSKGEKIELKAEAISDPCSESGNSGLKIFEILRATPEEFRAKTENIQDASARPDGNRNVGSSTPGEGGS